MLLLEIVPAASGLFICQNSVAWRRRQQSLPPELTLSGVLQAADVLLASLQMVGKVTSLSKHGLVPGVAGGDEGLFGGDVPLLL